MGLVGYFLYNIKYGDTNTLFNKYGNNNQIEKKSINTENFIHDHNPIFGPSTALVTIFAFEDFECPFCRQSFPIMKKIKEKYGPAIRIIFKHTPIVGIHPDSLLAHIASTCAQDQNKFWEYYDLLYTYQKLDKDSLLSYAESLAINNSKFQQCLETNTNLNNIETDLKDAAQIGLQGTPTYLVNGKQIQGVLSEDDWSNLILQELK